MCSVMVVTVLWEEWLVVLCEGSGWCDLGRKKVISDMENVVDLIFKEALFHVL